MLQLHGLADARIRLRLYLDSASKLGAWTALRKVRSLTDAQVKDALLQASTQLKVKLPPELFNVKGKLGDGSIIKAIKDFFASDLGQAILKAVVTILLALVMA